MRLQQLLLSNLTGFQKVPGMYKDDIITAGKRKFAEAFVAENITCIRMNFVERFNQLGGPIHARAPVPVIIYGTKERIEALKLLKGTFTTDVTNEPFATENTRVKAWLRVGSSDNHEVMFIVRDERDMLHRVDTFFRHAVEQAEFDAEQQEHARQATEQAIAANPELAVCYD